MVNMWASDVMMIRLCANALDEWAGELSLCKETEFLSQELRQNGQRLRLILSKSRSEQTPPDNLPAYQDK